MYTYIPICIYIQSTSAYSDSKGPTKFVWDIEFLKYQIIPTCIYIGIQLTLVRSKAS